MLLVEWVEVRKFIYAGLCLIPLVAFYFSGRGRTNKRLSLSVVPALFLCVLFVLWGLVIGASNDYLPPVYSSDGRFAARVSIGPFGEQVVELFSWYGFRKDIVHYGETSNDEDIRWVDDRTLMIPVQESPEHCTSRHEVKVICVPQQR